MAKARRETAQTAGERKANKKEKVETALTDQQDTTTGRENDGGKKHVQQDRSLIDHNYGEHSRKRNMKRVEGDNDQREEHSSRSKDFRRQRDRTSPSTSSEETGLGT